MGAALGCGAHLAEIVRTAVGEFTLDQAAKLEDLERASGKAISLATSSRSNACFRNFRA